MKAITGLNATSRRFLDAAFGSADKAWLVRGHYDANDKLVVLAEGPAGSFELSDEDDLYYCIGTVNGSRKTVERVYVLVIDDVGKEISREEFEWSCPLEPSYWRESSEGSFQVKFLIKGGEDPEQFEARRRAMKAHPVWGKAHNISAAAIYRLPQGTHTKASRNGWKVCDVAGNGAAYTPEQLDVLIPAGVSRTSGTTEVDEIEDAGLLRELVDLIPNPLAADRAQWVSMAHAIWGASAGEGYAAFEAWSERWEGGSDSDRDRRLWDSITESRIGRGWLRRQAEEADALGAAAWAGREAAAVFDDGVGIEVEAAHQQAMIEAHQQQVADDIVRAFGDRIRFNVDSGLWHRFDGSIWAPTKAELGFQYAAMWARRSAAGLKKGMQASIQKIGFPMGVEGYCRRHPLLMAGEDAFDQDPWLLGTPGGTVDLRTGVLRKARASDMISRCTSVTPSEAEDCPFWKARLIAWMTTVSGRKDPEMQMFLQQWAGYCLSGDTTEEKLLFLYGDGANGKGSYVDTLAAIAGTYFVQPARDLFMVKKHQRHAQELASLAGARMVACSEVPATADWDEGLLKDVTGGGMMSANFMRQNQFSFRVRFKVTISGNDKPAFSGRISEAIRRRFLLATFVNRANPVDPAFKPGLMREAPGILRWAINGAVAWHKTGLMVPVSVQGATDKYLDDEDLFGGWLRVRTQRITGAETGASDLMSDWIEHRNREGNHTVVDSQRKFADEMVRRGFRNRHTMSGSVYIGIVLKTKANSF